jgi:LmbE family N-acetylglucosaminyl deacetylase
MLRLGLDLAGARDRFRLLCLGAHADDIEIGAGGTVLRLVHEHPAMAVRWIVFSGNERRRAEAEASARHFLAGLDEPGRDVEVIVHDFRDGFLPAQWAAVKERFEDLKRAFNPSLVLTHCRDDLHQDHRTVAELTYNTFRDHLVWEYEIAKYDGDIGNPNLFAPLAEELCRRKIDAILEHFPSQRDHAWFNADAFMALLRLRGIHCNAPSGLAEGFYCRKAVV